MENQNNKNYSQQDHNLRNKQTENYNNGEERTGSVDLFRNSLDDASALGCYLKQYAE